MPLTDTAIRSARPQNKTVKMFDGGGLYLELAPSYGKKVRSLFEKQIVPVFGAKHIADVEPISKDFIKACEKIDGNRKTANALVWKYAQTQKQPMRKKKPKRRKNKHR